MISSPSLFVTVTTTAFPSTPATVNDVILAATEIYYLAEDDFKFQMLNALKHLIAAKVMYKKLDE